MINAFLTDRVGTLEAKREKLMTAAKAAKRANRTLGSALGNIFIHRAEAGFAKCSIM